jgi:nucleotide-binding universal stress UspA family protein
MNRKMKILVGYDGSDCSDAALDDLRRAGLPKDCEVVVLSVADVFQPPPINEAIDNTFPFYVPDGVRRAHEHAALSVREAKTLADNGCARIKNAFPGWLIKADATADSPAWALIKKADEWHPDLIVVGAQGHAVMGGRLILGSVSQRVLYEARCSVRIARSRGKPLDSPSKIVVGIDGSLDSYAAIEAVARRVWPAGSEVSVFSALDTLMCVTSIGTQESVVKWIDVALEEARGEIRALFEPLLEQLRQAGLGASITFKEGDPKQAIIEHATECNADSIFLGAKGTRGIDRLLLGSVSASVAARAPCSVEIVRAKD